MSKDLKTLEDFRFIVKLNKSKNNQDGHIDGTKDCIFAFRQEAIKWIKELTTGNEDELMKYKFFQDFEPSCEIRVVASFIAYFFNITEEDLK